MDNLFEVLSQINAVDGFDPMKLAVEYTDMNTGETNKRLPVKSQMAWFRLKYPEGKIALTVKPQGSYFVAEAKIYCSYQDAPENFLAQATAARGPIPDKPTVSPREWAQTAAVGVALRNAGFGLQFQAAGDSLEEPAVNELGMIEPEVSATSVNQATATPAQPISPAKASVENAVDPVSSNVAEPPTAPPVTENPLEKAMKMMCPASKFKDKTLGDMINLSPSIFPWIIKTFGEGSEIGAAAKLICEHAVQAAG